MRKQTLKVIGMAVLIVALTVINGAAVQAGDQPLAGDSPESAMAPTVGWTTVEPGESHWYTFNYDYDDDDGAKEAIATLTMASPGSISFVVQTLDRLGPWLDRDDDPGALGVGSPLFVGSDDEGDSVRDVHTLVWAGRARASGNYLIIVEGAGAYRLNVDGETINFTEPSLNSAMAFSGMTPASEMADEPSALAMMPTNGMGADDVQMEEFALTVEPAAAPAAVMAGSSADTAVSPTIGWAIVAPGESHWYAFNYDYDNGSDDPAEQAIALLEMTNPGSVSFEVQTMDRLGPYVFGDDIPGPLGVGSLLFRGTDDDGDAVLNPHKLVWATSARASERYFIIVTGDGPYRLAVSGDTVYFPETTFDGIPAFAMTAK